MFAAPDPNYKPPPGYEAYQKQWQAVLSNNITTPPASTPSAPTGTPVPPCYKKAMLLLAVVLVIAGGFWIYRRYRKKRV